MHIAYLYFILQKKKNKNLRSTHAVTSCGLILLQDVSSIQGRTQPLKELSITLQPVAWNNF